MAHQGNAFKRILLILFMALRNQVLSFSVLPRNSGCSTYTKFPTVAKSYISQAEDQCDGGLDDALQVDPSTDTNLESFREPSPPEVLPHVNEQMEETLWESGRRIQLYEKEVEMLREKLNLVQSEFLDEQNDFREERQYMEKQLDDALNLLAQRDEELNATLATLEEVDPQETTAELQGQVEQLEEQLLEKGKELMQQQARFLDENRNTRKKLTELAKVLKQQEEELAAARTELAASEAKRCEEVFRNQLSSSTNYLVSATNRSVKTAGVQIFRVNKHEDMRSKRVDWWL